MELEEEFENKRKRRKRRKLHHFFSGLSIVLGIATIILVLSDVDRNLQWLGVVLFLFSLGLSAYFLDDEKQDKEDNEDKKEEIDDNEIKEGEKEENESKR